MSVQEPPVHLSPQFANKIVQVIATRFGGKEPTLQVMEDPELGYVITVLADDVERIGWKMLGAGIDKGAYLARDIADWLTKLTNHQKLVLHQINSGQRLVEIDGLQVIAGELNGFRILRLVPSRLA